MPKAPDYSGSLYCPACHGKTYRSYFSGKMIETNGARMRRRVYYCYGCKLQWDADRADAAVEELMTADTSPEWEVRWVEGSDHSAELERIKDALRDLPRRELDEDAEDAERARLRAQRKRLEAMPVVAPRRELLPTGRTMADAWMTWTWAERVSYLRSGSFRVELTGRGMSVAVERVELPVVREVDVTLLPDVLWADAIEAFRFEPEQEQEQD